MNIMITSCQEFDAKVVLYSESGEKRTEDLPANTQLFVTDIKGEEVSIEFHAIDEKENLIVAGLEQILGVLFLLLLEVELEEIKEDGFWGLTDNFIITAIKKGEKYQGEILDIRYEKTKIMKGYKACCNVGVLSDDFGGKIKYNYIIQQKKFWRMFYETWVSIIIWAVIICGGISGLAYKSMGNPSLTIILPLLFLPMWCIKGIFVSQKEHWKSYIGNGELF